MNYEEETKEEAARFVALMIALTPLMLLCIGCWIYMEAVK